MAGKQSKMTSVDTDLETNDDQGETTQGDATRDGEAGTPDKGKTPDNGGDDIEVVEAGEDGRTAANDDGDSDGEDEKGGHDERHRETARERRERAKAAKLRDKRELDMQLGLIRRQDAELAEMRRVLNEERRQRIDDRIAVLREQETTFDQIERAALSQQKGDDAVQARDLREKARKQIEALEADRKTTEPQQHQGGVDPQVARMAAVFRQRHPWYNTAGTEEDTAIANAIDTQVAREGYDPRTPDYWAELERRVAERLPTRAPAKPARRDEGTEVDEERPARRGPPVGGSRSGGNASRRIVLSPSRVAALKEAGLWDDPKTRARMAQRYAQFDQDHNEEG